MSTRTGCSQKLCKVTAGLFGEGNTDANSLCILQAQRLTNLEKLVKKLSQQPQGPGHVAGASGVKGPDERLLRRLGSDLALVKRRLDEIAPPRDPGALLAMREGDHAMLAGKPLQGYRYLFLICRAHLTASFGFRVLNNHYFNLLCRSKLDECFRI